MHNMPFSLYSQEHHGANQKKFAFFAENSLYLRHETMITGKEGTPQRSLFSLYNSDKLW